MGHQHNAEPSKTSTAKTAVRGTTGSAFRGNFALKDDSISLPPCGGLPVVYGTVKGRKPSVGKRPVGPAAVEGCARNM